MAHHAWYRWLRVLGLILFVWIASQIDWLAVGVLLKDIRPAYVVAYFVVFISALMLKVLRLKWLLAGLGYVAGFREVSRSVIEPAFYGMVTPARLGEFSKVAYLTRFGLTARLSWGVVLMERLVDFAVLFLASVSGLLVFFFGFSWLQATFVFLGLMVVLYVGIINLVYILNWVQMLWRQLPTGVSGISEILALQDSGVRLIRLGAVLILPVTLVVLALSFWQLSLLGKALDADVPGMFLGLAYTVSSLVSLLPISIGGLGTREAIYIGLLDRYGVASSLAVTISLLDGLVFPLIALFALFVFFLFQRR